MKGILKQMYLGTPRPWVQLAKELDTLTKGRGFDPGIDQGVEGGILAPKCLS